MSSVAAIEADVGATGTGDRWFWLRGTFGAVGLLTLLWGQLVVPKFVALFQELDFTDLPFPLLLTAWVDRTVGGIAGYVKDVDSSPKSIVFGRKEDRIARCGKPARKSISFYRKWMVVFSKSV